MTPPTTPTTPATYEPLPADLFDALASHPRLHVGPDAWEQLSAIQNDSWYASYVGETAKIADAALDVQSSMASFKEEGHNWHLIRARTVQTYTWSLIVQYRMTGQAKYKDAAMAYVKVMHDWEYWSWITWRKGEKNPAPFYDLSYGENAATLAIINDWLWEDLTDDDKALILTTARRPIDHLLHFFNPLPDGREPNAPHWFGQHQSNWNTVCAGGMGMLALSLYEQLPEAKQLLNIVEQSITPYMKSLVKNDGAWPEGIGYWNYGMRYAFMYLLSYEQATGKKHWGLEQPATRESLSFPVLFCPNGVPCSYGDVNQWTPLPFHHATARRCGADDLAAELFVMHPVLSPARHTHGLWPNAAETLLQVRRVISDTQADSPQSSQDQQTGRPAVKLFQGQDWGYIADRFHSPSLYMTVRGGTTTAPHGHIDVTSYHAGVKDEAVIYNQGVREYLDTTFSPRRFDLYDTTPGSKNVVLVSGAGAVHPSAVITKQIELSPQIAGLHIDATEIFTTERDGPAVKQYCRSYLMIDNQALLVLDHVILPQPGRLESRLHTPMQISPSLTHDQSIMSTPKLASVLQLTGQRQKAQLHLACSEPARVFEAVTLATSPSSGYLSGKISAYIRVIRWIGDELYSRIAFATLILPSELQDADTTRCNVKADQSTGGVDVELNLPWGKQTLKLNSAMDELR